MTATPVLSVQNLSKSVQDSSGVLTILHTLAFDVAPGESVAIVGASGSGKSTLLSLLAGLDTPTEGEIWMCGQNLASMNEDQRAAHRARHVGFVFQNFQLISHLTALENVMLPMELQGDAQASPKAKAMLERVGLGQRLQHRPVVMSGGEQQRVAMARAFVMQPDILMADEPTGNLDPSTSVGIMRLLDRINRQGTTVVMATHDDEIVDQMRKRVIELKGGEVVRDQDRGVYGSDR